MPPVVIPRATCYNRLTMVALSQQDELGLDATARALWLRRCVAGFALLLFALTVQLWTPQRLFPQVPLIDSLAAAPHWCDWIGLALLASSLFLMLVTGPTNRLWRPACLVFAAAWLVMTLLDQHRLQPWAYQFALLAVVLATCPAAWAMRLLRALTISIYCYSALSKLDHTFLFTIGQQLLAAALGMVGVSPDARPEYARIAGAAAFPVFELVVADLLSVGRTRRLGLAAAIAMHGLLIVILGPLGLGHRPGVLAWNVYFIVQNWILFGGSRAPASLQPSPPNLQKVDVPTRYPLRWLGTSIAGAAMLLPVLEPFGWFDHWPSWALYAPQGGYITLRVATAECEKLPLNVRQHLTEPRDGDEWRRLRIDRWSLSALGVPIYPQQRFQLGVASDLIDRYELQGKAEVTLFDSASRWTGGRGQTTLADRDAIERAASEFWLGALPRP